MAEVKNIKKKKTGNIYWGIRASGEYVHISTVDSGLACQCSCAACGQPLEARKGMQRRHHFAHVSNYECLYAYEVSVFKAVETILAEKKQLYIPDAVLNFHSNKENEIIRGRQLIDLQSTKFQCNSLQYPPELIVESGKSKLRVMLEFGRYYANIDIQEIELWAKEHDMACLRIKLPQIDKPDDYDRALLEALMLTDNEQKSWIYNRKVEEARKKFETATYYPEQHCGGYECFAHKGNYKGKYSVRWNDCVGCEYCYEVQPYCRCLAKAGVIHYSDLLLPEQVRMQRMREIISCNEQNIREQWEKERVRRETEKKRREEREAYSEARQRLATNQAKIRANRQIHINIDNQNYELGYSEIIDRLDANGTDPTFDSYGNRWCVCTECGTVKHTGLLASYGFGGANKGLCRECAKKQKAF